MKMTFFLIVLKSKLLCGSPKLTVQILGHAFVINWFIASSQLGFLTMTCYFQCELFLFGVNKVILLYLYTLFFISCVVFIRVSRTAHATHSASPWGTKLYSASAYVPTFHTGNIDNVAVTALWSVSKRWAGKQINAVSKCTTSCQQISESLGQCQHHCV